MSKKSVVLFIFLMVSLVLPFLFYFAWQGPVQMKGSEEGENVRLVDDSDEMVESVLEQEEIKEHDAKKENIEKKENSTEQVDEEEFVVSVSNSAAATSEYEEDSAAYVTFAPGVTAQMQDAQYWLDQVENPREVLWSGEEIQVFNQEVLNTAGMAYNIFSSQFRATFQSELVSGENEIRESEEAVILGEETSNAREVIKGVTAEQEIGVPEEWEYGICVNRAEIKKLPQEAPVGEDAYFDENLLTTARTNTPVLVDGQTGDGAYYHVIAYDYQGWTLTENIALCSGLEEWEQVTERSGWLAFAGATDSQSDMIGKNGVSVSGKKTGAAEEKNSTRKSVLIVTVPRLRLELTGEILTMGTTMHILTAEEAREVLEKTDPEKVENSGEDSTEGAQGALADTWGCYVVELAGRTTEGQYVPRYETIPISAGVSMEYLEFTRENLLNQMFLFAGQAYGWGGSYESVDCSGLVQDVIASFGLLFPRDAEEQQKVPLSSITFTADMEEREREEILNVLCTGDLLFFPGHIMFYLGQEQGEYYVFNAVGSMKIPEDHAGIGTTAMERDEELQTGPKMENVRRVIVNSLSVERKNGNSWLQELERAVLFSGKD